MFGLPYLFTASSTAARVVSKDVRHTIAGSSVQYDSFMISEVKGPV
tara:strand:- start:489 stop:626 length:138 start_codon:yes stop_codon:yes gene_type:complete